MKYNTALTLKSTNKKTGPIPVSTTTALTCPGICPFNHKNDGGCYAESGPLAIHWRKVTSGERGGNFKSFLEQIKKLIPGQLWRHNQAGDLPGDGNTLDETACNNLTTANKGKRGFSYTHYDINKGDNKQVIESMNKSGFTVNLSGNDVDHAIELKKNSTAPVVTVVKTDYFKDKKRTFKKGGVSFIQCPADYNKNVTCESCKLCAVPTRKSVVCFPAHGTQKNRINNR